MLFFVSLFVSLLLFFLAHVEGQARAPILTPLPPVGSIQRYPTVNQQPTNTGPPYNR